MRYLQEYVREYKETFFHEPVFDESIAGKIGAVQNALLDEKFHPSVQLRALFDKFLRRSRYPMEVAIVGQFSSGKSTFLNALLSRDILPTGITPVTSKVNYINYASEYKLKVTYKSGAEEYHPMESISRFTDQRESVEDIKYLSLYAPMDILRDISFVDTPGLNSQSLSDTQSTKKILRDVDGIIWLSLIDNAGKQSESEILETYLQNFKEKSLCVLNQKDKFSAEQIETTVAYINKSFASYFAKVIPISARQALESRAHQKEVLIEESLHALQENFKKLSPVHMSQADLGFFTPAYEAFQDAIRKIETEDNSNNLALMKESNIEEVMEFIEQKLRPRAKESKAYAIRKDLLSVCEIVKGEYETIKGVYESLEEILRHKEDELLNAYDEVYLKHSKSLMLTYDKLETVLETIARSIYENIVAYDALRYEEEKGLFGKISISAYPYEALKVDREAVMQKLFYENRFIDKQIKQVLSFFKSIQEQSMEDLRDVFRLLKSAVQLWQEPYEHITKHREIASDLEFARTRQFVAKAYENILLPYHRALLLDISDLQQHGSYFEGALGSSYRELTLESIYAVQEKIDKQESMHKKEPLKYLITSPGYENIFEVLKTNFELEKREAFLSSRRNYLYKSVENAKAQFKQINEERIRYVLEHKHELMKKIEEIDAIAKGI